MHKKQSTKFCHFCVNNNVEYIDWKDWQTIKKFTSSYGKIVPKRRSGVCSRHQRKLSEAIKRARLMAMLPFVNK